MPKTKIRNRNQFTAAEREHRIHHYLHEARNTLHVFRHAGAPDQAVLVGRSLLAMLANRVYVVMTKNPKSGRSTGQQIEEIRKAGIIGHPQADRLRAAAKRLNQIPDGRGAREIAEACNELMTIVRSSSFKEARAAVREPGTPRGPRDRRPRLFRWAAAACGFVGLGAS
ncbi:MAG: hypothetical protein AAF802_07665 [Planctomycetota bacterium]